MKKFLVVLMAVFTTMSFGTAVSAKSPPFPDKGWHKGPYLTANVGMMQTTNDQHSVTNLKFDGSIAPSFGLTFGWDIADWIGPMLQINYATTTGTAGDANNDAAAQTYGGNTFDPGTFPSQNAREHAINLGLYLRGTLPYFTQAAWQGKNIKVIPYLKLGGMGHALYVNAASTNSKVGAYGGGLGAGLGVELFIWKGFVVAIDATEHIIFQQALSKDITDSAGTSHHLKILDGGTKFQFNVGGLFGYHF